MELELLPGGYRGQPLMRIFGTDPAGFAVLHAVCRALAEAPGRTCRLQDEVGFTALDDCGLTMISVEEGGARCAAAGREVLWSLAPDGWSTIAGLIEPFATEVKTGTFQWLAGSEARFGGPTEVAMLLSCAADGRW